MASAAIPQSNVHFMRQMMQRLGIDPGAGVDPSCSLSYMTALHRCETCAEVKACRAWLEQTPERRAVPPSFCPNADIFFQMQVDQPGPHYGDRSVRLALRPGGI